MATVLKNGSSGDAVKRLQEQLNAVLKLNPPLTTDGKFGTKTERAVMAFQAKNKLGVDGIAGPKTQAALGAKLDGKPVAAPPPSPAASP
ncbi:MAG TPA: peptidoglycan-binding domain-containing protein [Cellvibrionaceae bacterium]|nr:peptidoglycan-binding domain-containing protein [Cellvibrionaceae bacterium]